MANYPLIMTYLLSYLFPLLIALIWGLGFKFKYSPKLAWGNASFMIFAFVALTYRNRALVDEIAVPLIFLSISIIYFFALVSFYVKGLKQGVKFWNSFSWKVITFFAHPLIVYPTVIIVSLIVDFRWIFFS
ncbi:MAG: hypothetical protein AABX26_00045 [Nanoarchaeota archaeon]